MVELLQIFPGGDERPEASDEAIGQQQQQQVQASSSSKKGDKGDKSKKKITLEKENDGDGGDGDGDGDRSSCREEAFVAVCCSIVDESNLDL